MSGKVLDYLAPRGRVHAPQAEAGSGDARHWRLARDAGGAAWLTLDVAGARTNTLSTEVLEELDVLLTGLEQDPPAGLVLCSAKPAGFAAGADIREFAAATDAAAVAAQLSRAHRLVDRLAALDTTSVALVHGHCLGGGLELALACRHRIAVAGASLGFPEVRLGLHPGLGGTVRATRLLDPGAAMTLMLTGRPVDARRAHRLGLVDQVVEERHAAAAVAAALAGALHHNTGHWRARVLNTRPLRQLAAMRMRAVTARKARAAHYPAPFALIDLWRDHGGDAKAMQREEVASFARLLVSDTAHNLARAFFLHQRLDRLGAGGTAPKRVHVIGAGTMGADIAAWCALRGLATSLTDRDPEVLAKAVARSGALFERRVKGRAAQRDARDRLIPDFAGDGVAAADLVIEAVPEDARIKHAVFREAEPRMKPGAMLASNTSSIALDTLRDGLTRPASFVGLHFFNPVAKMMLVEVVGHDRVAGECLDDAMAFVAAIGKLAAPVASAPGFLVNRALMPYLLEAMVMLGEGVAAETLDRAAVDFGMPMGPAELADRVGLDVCLHVADVLRGALDRPLPEVPPSLREKVNAGDLGVKSGAGIYRYRDGKPVKAQRTAAPGAGMADRLLLPLVDACVACLRNGVCGDADLVDAAMIFGTGFAPFRGGPLHYARRRGVADVTATLSRLSERHGEHLAPDAGWARLDEWC